MIRIQTLKIKEFRGIRNLELDFAGENFAICGPNGSGKSGVVDAIEFCLTGEISRLLGEGTEDLAIKKHGPHVDQRDTPEKAKVFIKANIPSLGKDVEITRCANTPAKFSVNPAGGKEEEFVNGMLGHKEFVLTRNDIAKYILTPPTQRAAKVQTLLRLDYVGRLRDALKKYANSRKSEADVATRSMTTAEENLKNMLEFEKFDKKEMLAKANAKRAILNLSPIKEISNTTSFKEGVVVPKAEVKEKNISKEIAIADLNALSNSATDELQKPVKSQTSIALKALNMLKEDHSALVLARRQGFIRTGLDMISEDACPLCDKQWDAKELKQHLEAKLLSAKEINDELAKIKSAINGILEVVEGRINMVTKARDYASAFPKSISSKELDEYLATLTNMQKGLKSFLEDHAQIDKAISELQNANWSLPKLVQGCVEKIMGAINSMPDTTAIDQAREFLIRLDERYMRFVEADKAKKIADAQMQKAKKLHDIYAQVSNGVLEEIYRNVAAECSAFYKFINGDEKNFKVELKPEQQSKLGFHVDFWGRGLFPVSAYHSEGHQDGMGLCLYLALMKNTYGDQFNFVVLDDILTSVDAEHRRKICRLLNGEFPKTQFIITTHDRVWLMHMNHESLIKKSKTFSNWKVETGPTDWETRNVWTEIQQNLEKDNVKEAAWLLRNYLEYIAYILAHNLRANVSFRGDDNYTLEDLLPAALTKWQDRLKKGFHVATQRKNSNQAKSIDSMLNEAKKLVKVSNMEKWQINPLVHYNEWANFASSDFKEVVDAFKKLLKHIRCPDCGNYPYLSPPIPSAETLRCDCMNIIINLKGGK